MQTQHEFNTQFQNRVGKELFEQFSAKGLSYLRNRINGPQRDFAAKVIELFEDSGIDKLLTEERRAEYANVLVERDDISNAELMIILLGRPSVVSKNKKIGEKSRVFPQESPQALAVQTLVKELGLKQGYINRYGNKKPVATVAPATKPEAKVPAAAKPVATAPAAAKKATQPAAKKPTRAPARPSRKAASVKAATT